MKAPVSVSILQSPRARLAALVAGLSVLGAGAGLVAQVFHATVDVVGFAVTVVDKRGNLVTDLGEAEFEVIEDGRPQAIKFFARGDDTGATPELHVGLVFDTSGSMDEDIALARTAAIKLIKALPEAADVTLVDFDNEVRVARFSQEDFPRMVERIRSRKPDGETALYDALGTYLHGAGAQDGRKVVVVYSDGADNRSSLNYAEIVTLLKASDVTMYTIGFLNHLGSYYQLETRSRLQRLTEPTGGQAFAPGSLKDIEQAYDKVLADIKAQYTLGYVSTNAGTDGRWRKVEIRVTRPGLKTRTRQGYFAPYRRQP